MKLKLEKSEIDAIWGENFLHAYKIWNATQMALPMGSLKKFQVKEELSNGDSITIVARNLRTNNELTFTGTISFTNDEVVRGHINFIKTKHIQKGDIIAIVNLELKKANTIIIPMNPSTRINIDMENL